MKYPGFVSGTYRAKNPLAASERTVNWFVEPLPASGANAACLMPIPGERTFSTGTVGPGRALFEVGGRVFGLFAEQLEEIFADGTRTTRMSGLQADQGPSVIVHNTDGGNQLFVRSGRTLYVMNLATNVVATVDAASQPVDDVTMSDGYVLTLDATDSTVYQSAKYSSTIAGDAFFQRAAESDRWVAILRHDREVWIFGERTTEVWANDGGFPLAFAAIPSARITYGIAAKWSKVSVSNALLWLSQTAEGTGEVVMATGLSARVVSDYAFAAAVQNYARIDDAVGWAYQDGSHLWYVLEFPTAGVTWTYDLTTKTWAERGEWDSVGGRYRVWHPRFHVFAFGQHLCLDGTGPNVLALDASVGTHASGNPIRWYREAPSLIVERKPVFYSRFEVLLRSGQGTSTGQGENPQLELLISRNGGETWRSQGTRSAGKQGDFGKSVVWRRLGRAEQFKAAVVATDPIRWDIYDAVLEVA